MSRRKHAAFRCARCHMHQTLCVCDLIPALTTRTKVVLVIHRYEDRKPTNTGRLATECLTEREVLVRGHEGDEVAFVPDPARQAVLLFPHEDAVPLDRFMAADRPLTLVVPDGTWRQASKVRKRVPGLATLPCAMLPAGDVPSRYRLRAEAHDHGLATLEAIARALGILEGAQVRDAIEGLFHVMVERTLWARGILAADAVTGGIPERARLHDWSSVGRDL